MSTPRGWELIRLPLNEDSPRHSSDDLLALARAVREVGFGLIEREEPAPQPAILIGRRKGHLAVVADND